MAATMGYEKKRKEQIIQREPKIHEQINHPNIIKLYKSYFERSCTYLLLEFC